jgi:hypothetical protein
MTVSVPLQAYVPPQSHALPTGLDSAEQPPQAFGAAPPVHVTASVPMHA